MFELKDNGIGFVFNYNGLKEGKSEENEEKKKQTLALIKYHLLPPQI